MTCTIGKYLGPRFGWNVWTRRSVPCDKHTRYLLHENRSSRREHQPCEQCEGAYMPSLQFGECVSVESRALLAKTAVSPVHVSRWSALAPVVQVEDNMRCMARNESRTNQLGFRQNNQPLITGVEKFKIVQSQSCRQQRSSTGGAWAPKSPRQWRTRMQFALGSRLSHGMQQFRNRTIDLIFDVCCSERPALQHSLPHSASQDSSPGRISCSFPSFRNACLENRAWSPVSCCLCASVHDSTFLRSSCCDAMYCASCLRTFCSAVVRSAHFQVQLFGRIACPRCQQMWSVDRILQFTSSEDRNLVYESAANLFTVACALPSDIGSDAITCKSLFWRPETPQVSNDKTDLHNAIDHDLYLLSLAWVQEFARSSMLRLHETGALTSLAKVIVHTRSMTLSTHTLSDAGQGDGIPWTCSELFALQRTLASFFDLQTIVLVTLAVLAEAPLVSLETATGVTPVCFMCKEVVHRKTHRGGEPHQCNLSSEDGDDGSDKKIEACRRCGAPAEMRARDERCASFCLCMCGHCWQTEPTVRARP